MTRIVFWLESKTFLTKPQRQKAGFYRAKKPEKHNTHNSWHLRFNSHFKVFLISSLSFSYKHHNQNTFVCFDFQNTTTPKDKKISLQHVEVTSMLQLLFLYQEQPILADFLDNTEHLAVGICPASVPGGGKPKTDGCQRTYLITCNWDTLYCYVQDPWSCFQKGKGWQSSWTAYAWTSCYLTEKKLTSADCELCGCAQYLGDQSYDFPVLASTVRCGLNPRYGCHLSTSLEEQIVTITSENCDFSSD